MLVKFLLENKSVVLYVVNYNCSITPPRYKHYTRFPKSAEKHETNNNHVFQIYLVNVGAQCWRFYFFLILKVIAGSLIVYLVVLDMAQLC